MVYRQTLWTRDSSVLIHFSTIVTGPNCPDSSALVLKCTYETLAPVLYCLQFSYFLTCELRKYKQCNAL